MNEFLKGFNIDNDTQEDLTEDQTVGLQNDGCVNKLRNVTLRENTASHNQVIEKNIAGRVRKDVDNVVAAIEKQVHDAISTAMDSLVMPRVEMAERSITGS